jgi:hypothetical protein
MVVEHVEIVVSGMTPILVNKRFEPLCFSEEHFIETALCDCSGDSTGGVFLDDIVEDLENLILSFFSRESFWS